MRRLNPRHWSIAARLFVSAAVLSSIILVIAGAGLSALYRKSAETRFDEQLGFYLRALVADIASPSEENRPQQFELGEPQFEIPLSGWYWQITRLDGNDPNIISSRSLFAERLPQLVAKGVPAGVGGARDGYVKGPDEKILRMVERTIDTGDEGIYLVQVAATTAPMESEVEGFELALIVTFTLLAGALVGSAVLQMRYGLEPLRRLQEGVASIRRGQGERIGGEFPQDIAPLASEVNLLLDANREVVERARTQVGNLAHALKTPLSVIINEADTEKGPLSSKVHEQAAIMRDQVTYYLDRARAAVRVGAIGNMAEVAPATMGLVRTFEKIYRERGINFSAQVADNIRFRGERQDLEEMIGNLVDNAGKWARQNVTIAITALGANSQGKKFFRVVIDDDGVGLAPELREAAMRRGRRLDETRPGSGLGLSIVADLAALYGGALRLDASPAGGLRAELELPAAA
ncbi:MAG: ATP-binding protein [Methylovirgula sp.]